MPYIALNEFDDEVTAYQCRDEYLRNGTEYKEFRCAFCEVKYFSRAIYVEQESAKAPHFSKAKGHEHLDGCDGEPIIETPPKAKSILTVRVLRREYDVPERLIERVTSRKRGTLLSGGKLVATPSRTELERRRKAAGKIYGTAQYTSSLLQIIVEAKKNLLRMCYEEVRSKNLNDIEAKKLIKNVMTSHSLFLYDTVNELNYDAAFWNATTIRKGNGTRIYHATSGIVTFTPEGFNIVSAPSVPKQGKVKAQVRYEVANEDEDIPRAHRKVLEHLRQASIAGTTVDWHAYGTMQYNDADSCILILTTLDHLYVK